MVKFVKKNLPNRSCSFETVKKVNPKKIKSKQKYLNK